jgi:glycosyltransferase 2 family protein
LAWIRAAGVLAAALFLAVLIAVVVLAAFGERPLAFAFRHLARLPLLPLERLRTAPANFLQGLLGLRQAATGIAAFLWTTLSWVVLGIGFWLVMLAFDLRVSPLGGLLVVIATGLAMILLSSPAALGVFEGATVLTLMAYDVPESSALSYALVLHALTVFPFLLLAPPVLRRYWAPARAFEVEDEFDGGGRAR